MKNNILFLVFLVFLVLSLIAILTVLILPEQYKALASLLLPFAIFIASYYIVRYIVTRYEYEYNKLNN